MITELELIDADMEQLPSLELFPLEEINLEGNRLMSLEGLPMTLKKLNADRNKLGLSGILVPFPNLKELSLNENRIRMFEDDDFVTCYPSLQILYLNSNEISQTKFLSNSSLEEVSLSDNPIRCLDKLPSTLKKLYISNSSLRMIQSRLPPRLEVAVLARNHLRFAGLPFHWGTSLRSLYLESNRISKFPRNLPDSLEFLNLSDNFLEEIPETLPKNLKILWIYKNRIRQFPKFTPNRFESLWLNDNCLITLPDESVAPKFFASGNNWNEQTHHEAQRCIKKCWKRYVLTLRLRHYKRTQKTKEELFMISMMPERWQQVDTIDPSWYKTS